MVPRTPAVQESNTAAHAQPAIPITPSPSEVEQICNLTRRLRLRSKSPARHAFVHAVANRLKVGTFQARHPVSEPVVHAPVRVGTNRNPRMRGSVARDMHGCSTSSAAPRLTQQTVSLDPDSPIPGDANWSLVGIINAIAVARGVKPSTETVTIEIPDFGARTFLRVTFSDWEARCAQLSNHEWDRSYHGAIVPNILSIALQNKINEATVKGAGGKRGGLALFHSNNGGLKYPFKYAYPSPLLQSQYNGKDEACISVFPSDVPLYNGLIEIRVKKPMQWCDTSGGKKWHYTPNAKIRTHVELCALLFCIYTGARSVKHMHGYTGHICMKNGKGVSSV